MGTKTITGFCEHLRGEGDTTYEADAAQGAYYTLPAPASLTSPEPTIPGVTRIGRIRFNLNSSDLYGKVVTGVSVTYHRKKGVGIYAAKIMSISPGGGFSLAANASYTKTYGSDIINEVQKAINNKTTMDFKMCNDETNLTERDVNTEGTKTIGWYTDSYAKIDAASMTITYADSYTVSYGLANSLTSGQSIDGLLPTSDTVVEGSSYKIKNCTAKKIYESGTYTVNFNWNTSSSDSDIYDIKTVNWENIGAFAYYWQGSTRRNPGDFITINANTTLNAAFYGGTKTVDDVSFPPEDPTLPGYKFNGWATSRSGKPISNYTPTDNATLYAIWELEKYTITYNANGGSVSPDSEKINPGSSTTLPTPTRSGYEFNGWYTSGGTKVGDKGESYKPTASITLYAHWLQQYTITYNANGGSDAPGNQTKTHGVDIYLSPKEPSRSSTNGTSYTVTFKKNDGTTSNYSIETVYKKNNYSFSTWNTNANGTGKNYEPGEKYTSNANLNLFAIWNTSTSSATVDNPGSPTRYGYTFEGWNTDKNATTGLDFPQTITATTFFYAIWKPKTYTFTFNDTKQGNTTKNGEYGSTITLPARSSVTVTGSSTTLYHTLDNPSFTSDESRSTKKTPKTTYPFNGWLYDNTLYGGGYSQTVDGNRTYTASYGSGSTSYEYTSFQLPSYSSVKVSTTITTTLNYNYGNISDTIQSGGTITHTHSDWKSGNTIFSKNETVSPKSNTSYTSRWSSTTTYNKINNLPKPSREGYNFLGWFTKDGKDVTEGYTPTTNNTTIYAHWEVANFITTVTRYISDSASEVKERKCEVYYYIDNKWMPIEEIKYYKDSNSKWVQVGEQIPYVES